jgi:exodeoxyribonuclease VII large subunit
MDRVLNATESQEAVPLPVVVKRIKAAVAQVQAGWIEAEINRVSEKRGHYWLELAGGDDTLRAVMWSRDARRVTRDLPEPLAKGQKIHARYDRVDFYGPHGAIQIIISAIRFVGEGELLRRRQESLQRLQREGLCDRKRSLPAIPRCIGLIAGRDTDGQFDVLDAIKERWPPANIKFVPSLVQGARAPEELIRSLLTLEGDAEVDVIALCRGGGSVQDLLAFDDEELCRIIANTETPVVAAIGHSRNRPNAYYVADAEVPVPLAVAELLVPAKDDHLRLFGQAGQVIARELDRAGDRVSLLDGLHKRSRRFFDLGAQHSRLQELDALLEARGAERLRASGTELEVARQAIDTAWHGIPGPSALDAPRARLFAAAERTMQREHKELTSAQRSIPLALGKIPHPAVLDPHAERLVRAASRVCEERAARIGQMGSSLTYAQLRSQRAAARTREEIGSQGDRIVGAARKRFEVWGRAVDAHLRHIAALDPSARGFALLRNQRGAIVDSATALRSGQAIRLELHDGSAEGHIDRVTTSKKEME